MRCAKTENWLFFAISWVKFVLWARQGKTGMTLYWIQYFIIFIAMDVYIFVNTFECILRNPLTTFHQLAHIESAFFFLFSFAENCTMSIFVYSLAKGKNGFHSFWHGCIYSHDDDDDGDDDITQIYEYLPICSIDTSRKKRDIRRLRMNEWASEGAEWRWYKE